MHDPYLYTSGRWLHRDELQRRSRTIRFSFPALCDRAIKLCPGASKITRYEKKEGGFNRVFIFTMDTGVRIVARLPTPTAGLPRLTTNSEVATMILPRFKSDVAADLDFVVRAKTSLPIPKILDWNNDPSNPVGTEYII